MNHAQFASMSQRVEGTSYSAAVGLQAEDEDSSIVYRGAVFKLARNGRLSHRWHRRYAVLNSEGHLYLYSDEGMRSVRRVVDLQQMCLRIKFGVDTSDDYCSSWPKRVPQDRRFSLINMDRTYHFFTASRRDAESWKSAFLSIAESKSIFTANWALTRSADPSEPVADQSVLELQAKPRQPKAAPLHMLFNTEQPAETVVTTEEVKGDEEEESKDDKQVLEQDEEGQSQENKPEPPLQHAMEDHVNSPAKDESSPYDDFGPKEQSSLTDQLATSENDAAKKRKKKTSLQRSVSTEVKEDRAATKSSAKEELSSALPQESVGSIEESPPASVGISPNPQETPVSPSSPVTTMTEGDEAPLEKEEEKRPFPTERRMSDYESQVHRLSQNLDRSSRKRSGKRLLTPPRNDSQEGGKSPIPTQGEREVEQSIPEASTVQSQPEQEDVGRSTSFGKEVNTVGEPEDQPAGHSEDKKARADSSEEAPADRVVSPIKHFSRAVSPSPALGSVPEGGPLAASTPQDKQQTQGFEGSSVMDRVKALSASGTISPPPLQPQPGPSARKERHRRISEPVKTAMVMVNTEQELSLKAPKGEGLGGQPAEPAKKTMKKYISEGMVGEAKKAGEESGGSLKPLPWEEKEESRVEDRLQAAASWMDKELRKLISEVQRLGQQNERGQWEVEFGLLFDETANVFEALSGILKTAKKHKILSYKGELLFQGLHDKVIITLLKEEIEDSTIAKYTTTNPKGMKRTDLPPEAKKKTSGFSTATTFTGDAKCAVCQKRVYATEFVAANDKPMHKLCFKCVQCGKTLTTSTFATIEDRFYCIPHYERLYLEKGSYKNL